MAAGRAAVGAMAMAIVLGAVLLLTNFHDGESKGNTGRVVLKQNAAVRFNTTIVTFECSSLMSLRARRWMNTLKGAESFLSDAENGKLPAKAIVPGEFDSVEKLLKKTKEQVPRRWLPVNLKVSLRCIGKRQDCMRWMHLRSPPHRETPVPRPCHHHPQSTTLLEDISSHLSRI
eukprot:765792-Hanusia_phi.AAC.2